jgi:hypothetical protein
MNEQKRALEVVEIATGKVVHSVQVFGSDRQVEKVERGLLRNMDTDKFFVRDTRDAESTSTPAR